MIVALPDGIIKKLKQIKRRTSLTDLVDVIRKALELYDLMTVHKAAGGRIFLSSVDDQTEELLLPEVE